jgi:hypothetical protein
MLQLCFLPFSNIVYNTRGLSTSHAVCLQAALRLAPLPSLRQLRAVPVQRTHCRGLQAPSCLTQTVYSVEPKVPFHPWAPNAPVYSPSIRYIPLGQCVSV